MDQSPVLDPAQDEDVPMPVLHLASPPVQTTARGGGHAPARKTKGRRTKKKALKIIGLDLLHTETLQSTSAQGEFKSVQFNSKNVLTGPDS